MPRALISVSDKTGLERLGRGLHELGLELVATGGSRAALLAAGLPVTAVEELTGVPELLGGRVKTLHPAVHAGLLARRTPEQLEELRRHGLEPFDVVVANLYPFREAAAEGAAGEELLEWIDIGGPTMIRAAAKNHPAVLVVVDPADYDALLEGLGTGVPAELRRALARKAFAHTAAYDAAIVRQLDREAGAVLPPTLHPTLALVEELRYGENPHQVAGRYREEGGAGAWDAATQHKGGPLSYLNLLDAEAAWRLVHRFDAPACVVVKHAGPCGVAVAEGPREAYERAFACDPISAFGGVVALNRRMDGPTAASIMANPKADVVIAPSYEGAALEALRAKRKAMRVLEAPPPGEEGLGLRRVDGGFLVQTPDAPAGAEERAGWRVVTRAQPTEALWRDLELAWEVCAATPSNAVVLTAGGQAVGIGGGQPSRVEAAQIAARKAAGRAAGGAGASDAFFPFRDGLDAVAAAGVAAVIQPGGSVRDDEVIAAADEHGLAMVLTGRRRFRH